jgi:hypothetical protein
MECKVLEEIYNNVGQQFSSLPSITRLISFTKNKNGSNQRSILSVHRPSDRASSCLWEDQGGRARTDFSLAWLEAA